MATYYSAYRRKRKKSKSKKWLWIVVLFLFIVLAVGGYMVYRTVFAPNVWVKDGTVAYVYIGSQDDFDAIKQQLYQNGHILNRRGFEYWAKYKEYSKHIKPGRYKIYQDMSNNELLNLLRSGQQEAVKLSFNNIRLKSDLAQSVAQQLEFDSLSLVQLLNDVALAKSYGFNAENVMSMFIPNTYFMYWNSTPKQFCDRMKKEYDAFWNVDRRSKAQDLDLTLIEVSVLASIVEKETNQNTEKVRVAGVYLNRLKAGWRLQADPTLVYALGDFSIRRVLNVYKDIESPYNTYKYVGLPPGPICVPSISSIDAVLNAENHSYFFFCAKADGSGYHSFARTIREHNANAKAFRAYLDKNKVFK